MSEPSRMRAPQGDPCILVIFGASGDLTKRLLTPALYNLACDGLLSERFAIVGMSMSEMTTDSFREKMSAEVRTFSTRKEFNPRVWDDFVQRLYYTPGNFDDPAAYERLADICKKLDGQLQTGGNFLFYLATPA